MSKQAMGYIIEKMRGDSLTPLGTSKGDSEYSLIRMLDYNNIGYVTGASAKEFSHSLTKYLEKSTSTFLYGKWEYDKATCELSYRLMDNCYFSVYIVSNPQEVFIGFKIIMTGNTLRFVLYIADGVSSPLDRIEAEEDCIKFVKEKFGIEAEVK